MAATAAGGQQQVEDQAETMVFYRKMAGDYWRYMAEIRTGDERRAAVDNASAQYEAASRAAQTLSPAHPGRSKNDWKMGIQKPLAGYM